MPICKKCAIEKQIHEFYKRKVSTCKKCLSAENYARIKNNKHHVLMDRERHMIVNYDVENAIGDAEDWEYACE